MKKKLVITFHAQAAEIPLVYLLVKKFDIKINILKAEIRPGKKGNLLAELDADEDKIEEAVKWMEGEGIKCSPVSRKTYYDETKCVHCGNCASACFAGALTIGPPDWKLNFDPEKCIACELCVKACPHKLFSIDFVE